MRVLETIVCNKSTTLEMDDKQSTPETQKEKDIIILFMRKNSNREMSEDEDSSKSR